jgi:hypothetical protein
MIERGGYTMRQRLGKKKMEALRKQTGLAIVAVMVRGGTDHREDLCLDDGSIIYLYQDGTMEKAEGITHEMKEVDK